MCVCVCGGANVYWCQVSLGIITPHYVDFASLFALLYSGREEIQQEEGLSVGHMSGVQLLRTSGCDLTLKHILESSLVSFSVCVLYFQADYNNLKSGDSMKYSYSP